MKDNIAIIFPGKLEHLPPILNAIDYFNSINKTVLLFVYFSEKTNEEKLLTKGNQVFSLKLDKYPVGILNKIVSQVKFLKLVRKQVKNKSVETGIFNAAHSFVSFLFTQKYFSKKIIHCHEYYNRRSRLWKMQNFMVKNADWFVSPEENRAWLTRIDTQNTTPFIVIPNCNDFSYIENNLQNNKNITENRFIYQGLISKSRNLDRILDAFNKVSFENRTLILMGTGDNAYLADLKSKANDKIIFEKARPFPTHLEFTKNCKYGVLSYHEKDINNVYCAPNKLYEFAYFGLPMIFPAYPGLMQLNSEYNFGISYKPWDESSIISAIEKITKTDYAVLSAGSIKLYSETLKMRSNWNQIF